MVKKFIDTPIFEGVIQKESRGGHGLNKLSLSKASSKYSTDKYMFVDTEWNGYFVQHLYRCLEHKIDFNDTPQSIYGRKSTKCPKCLSEIALSKVDKFALKAFEFGFLLICTKWINTKTKYLFYCLEHNQLHVSTYNDLIYVNKGLLCCYNKKTFDKQSTNVLLDTIAKYMVYRS